MLKNIKDAMQILEEKLTELQSNEDWINYLKFQSQLYCYSFNNVILLISQKPDVTMVMSFKKWKELGRTVKKGEKALKIYAPRFKKEKDEKTGEEENRLNGFILVPVFDISQTEGKEIPDIEIHKINGDSEAANNIISSISSICDIPIEYYNSDGEENGYFAPRKKIIAIKSYLDNNHKAKTLVHEYTHYLVHQKGILESLSDDVNEVVAESTAFIVCNYFGLDTGDYSIGYVNGWSGGDIDIVKKAGSTIQKLSKNIIDAIENLQEAEIKDVI